MEYAAYNKHSADTAEYIEKLKTDIKKNEIRLMCGAKNAAEIRAKIQNAKFQLAMLNAPTMRAAVINGALVEYR